MNDSFEQLMESLIGQAAATVGWEVLVWTAGGIAFGLVLFFGSLAILNLVLGDVEGRWSGSWRAVMVLCALAVPSATGVVGFCQGIVSGAEKALRQSEFARTSLPKVTDSVVGLYAVVYYADPETITNGDYSDLISLSMLREAKGFVDGDQGLDAARMRSRLERLEGQNLAKMATEARDDMRKIAPQLEGFSGATDALDVVLTQAVERTSGKDIEFRPLDALAADLDVAANLRGDPSTLTRAELTEHARERVVIPGIIAPLRALLVPWEWGAGLVAAITWLFALVYRCTAWFIGVRSKKKAQKGEDDPKSPLDGGPAEPAA